MIENDDNVPCTDGAEGKPLGGVLRAAQSDKSV